MDKLVFYDTEKEFALAFSRYLSRRASLPCRVETFTEEAPLAACLASCTPLLLLTTKKDYTGELARLAGPRNMTTTLVADAASGSRAKRVGGRKCMFC